MAKSISYEFYTEQEIGTNLFGIIDSSTGYRFYTTLAHPQKQYPAVIAFAGARFSRSELPSYELLLDIKGSKKSAQKRLSDIFNNYGHASVADMSLQFAYLHDVTLFSAFYFFYSTSVGAGQERSTRYQDYSSSSLISLSSFMDAKHPAFKSLEKEYLELGHYAIDSYEYFKSELNDAYKRYFKPGDDKAKNSALQSRVFDSARYFLLCGFRSSLAYITSSREWSRLIAEFKENKGILFEKVGEELEGLFRPPEYVMQSFNMNPEAPDLIKHTQPPGIIKENVKKLRGYMEEIDASKHLGKGHYDHSCEYVDQSVDIIGEITSGEMLLLQYLMVIYSSVNSETLVKYIKNLPTNTKRKISEIIFSEHNNYIHMDNTARLSSTGFLMNLTIGEARDINRHRSFGRFSPIFGYVDSYEEFLNNGFGIPLYLRDIKIFERYKAEFISRMAIYYAKVKTFIQHLNESGIKYDKSVVLMLLPLATNIQYIMHGSPKEISYFTQQRVRPGGHINYREIAYLMAEAISTRDPLLSSMMLNDKPDATSRIEFFDRS